MTFNILPVAMAATSILGCNKQFEYYPINEAQTTINEIGNEIVTLPEPVTYTGSIQPVSNKLYEQLGLDLTKNYKVVYCPQLLLSLAEQTATGKIKYDGRTFDIIENKNWWETNGYTRCVICEIKADREEETSEDDGDTQELQDTQSDI